MLQNSAEMFTSNCHAKHFCPFLWVGQNNCHFINGGQEHLDCFNHSVPSSDFLFKVIHRNFFKLLFSTEMPIQYSFLPPLLPFPFPFSALFWTKLLAPNPRYWEKGIIEKCAHRFTHVVPHAHGLVMHH